MFFRCPCQIWPAALRHGAAPDDVLAANNCGRKHLVLEVAVQQARVFGQREHRARLGQRARQRLLAGHGTDRCAGFFQAMDFAHDVQARVVRRQQPYRVDLTRHQHSLQAVEHMGRTEPEPTRLLGDARTPLGRTAVYAADRDVAHADHRLHMKCCDETGADKANSKCRQYGQRGRVGCWGHGVKLLIGGCGGLQKRCGVRRRQAPCAAARVWKPATPGCRDVRDGSATRRWV